MLDKILLCDQSFMGPGLLDRLQKDFSCETFVLDQCYDPGHYVFCCSYRVKDEQFVQKLKTQGFKIVVNYLDDSFVCESTAITGNEMTLRSKHWWWINEHFIYDDRKYREITTLWNPDKFFLLLMNLKRGHRDRLFEKVTNYLSDSLWSYVEQGYYIQDDVPVSTDRKGISDDRYYNPNWYASTMFSIAVETHTGLGRREDQCPPLGQRVFVTEKSYKPMAFKHAFVVYGTPGTLNFLQEIGFETFGHVVDESYDQIINDDLRLEKIDEQLNLLYKEYKSGKTLFGDPVSQQKIQHNFERFYNKQIVEQLWQQDIVEPLKNFLHT